MFKNKTLTFLENLQTFGWKLNLENINRLLAAWNNPHTKLKCIHIAGTNGKGSTSAILESIFRNAGYKTGLFTSPHLIEVNERIRVNGVNISDNDLSEYIKTIKKEVLDRECTYFETLTAIAFKYFYDCKVDIAVVEVGLGGRFDATNVISPILSVITEIDFDHEQYLGKNLSAIAMEKGGIIKSNTPCLIQTEKKEPRVEFEKVCQEKGADLFYLNDICKIEGVTRMATQSQFDLIMYEKEFDKLVLNIPGKVQIKNAALAIVASELLSKYAFHISENAIRQGLENVFWPGRLQILQNEPIVVVDVAHNVASIKILLAYLESFFQEKNICFIMGLLKDKNIDDIVKLISKKGDAVYIYTPESYRAIPAEELVDRFEQLSVPAKNLTNFSQVLDLVNPDEVICVTGSHYVVGDFLKYYKKA